MIKKNKIKIKLNGKINYLPFNSSIGDLLKVFKIPVKKVAIELNREIIDKNKLNKIRLKNKDTIEIVHFIGGG